MGKIIGGTPHGRHDALVDIEDAVLLDSIDVVAVHLSPSRGDDEAAIGLEFGGRVNHSTERREQLYLVDIDGAAGVVAEIFGLALRAGSFGELDACIRRRMEAMP